MRSDVPTIIYFLPDGVPTEEDNDIMDDFGAANVKCRNASVIGSADKPEECDAVAGNPIPDVYKDRPVVKTEADVKALFSERKTATKRKRDRATAPGAPPETNTPGGATETPPSLTKGNVKPPGWGNG